MALFGGLLHRRERKAPPVPAAGIRSLNDLEGYFPWPDLGMGCGSPARTEIRNPLAVAIRAVRVVEYAQATGSEHGDDGMVLLGLSQALDALGRHGEWYAAGTMLNALEVLIPPHDRRRWLDGLDPYIAPEGA